MRVWPILVALASVATTATAAGWQVEGQPGATPYRLSFAVSENVSYAFECRPDGVLVSETGVTQLMDVQTGAKIGDEPGATISPGAAYLMLMTKPKASPDFIPAKATPNPVRGWNLSVLLPKTDKQWRALPKAQMVSLMTTGWTGAVMLDAQSRAVISGFVQGCGS